MASKEMKAIIKIAGAIDPSLGKSISQATKGLGGIGTAFKVGGAVAVAGAAAATAAVVKFGVESVKAASSYESAFAGASTLMHGTEQEIRAISDSIISTSNETGIAAEDLASTVYNALSAGIDQADAVKFAGDAAKLAAAGFTDVDTALTATAKTLNAYGLEASETDRIQKVLMQTQNLGITTVGELGQSLAQVTPTAAAFGVEFEQVGAALAGMTAQGTPTAQATTQLNQLIAELGKSGTKASKSLEKAAKGTEYAGMSFSEMMESGADVGIVLDMIKESADKSGLSLVDMFSSIEAGKAALAISNSDFAGNLKQMATDADVVGEAYDKVTNTFEHQSKKLGNLMQNFKIEAGEAILPVLTDIAQQALPVISSALQELMPVIQGVMDVVGPMISELAQSALPMVQDAILQISPLVQQVMGFASQNLPLIADLMGQIGEMVLSIAGPIGESLMPILQSLFDSVTPILQSIVTSLLPPLQSAIEAMMPAIQAILSALQPIADLLLQIIPYVIQAAGQIIAAFTPVISFFSGQFAQAINNIMTVFGPVIEFIQANLEYLMGYITGVFLGNWQMAWENAKTFFANAWSSLAGVLKTAMNAVISVVNGAIARLNSLSVTIPAWVPIYGGSTFSLNVPQLGYLAKGGFTEGVSIAGEAGTEAVISFDPSERRNNLGYWAKAGKLLGVNATAVDTLAASAENHTKAGNSITFSPNITIQGNADYDTVLQALRDNEEEFMDMLAEFFGDRKGVSYG